MSALWTQLLATPDQAATLPWFGGRTLRGQGRTWRLEGKLPQEHGWHTFKIDGSRKATWSGEAFPDLDAFEGQRAVSGYLVGDRLIPEAAAVETNPAAFFARSTPLHLVEPGLERFSRVRAVHYEGVDWIFERLEFPLGPELAVLDRFMDRATTLGDVPGVPPALELAFRWESWQRDEAERRAARIQARLEAEARAQAERLEAEARREHLRKVFADTGTGEDRRKMARRDFAGAARAALAVSGAELLDHRNAPNKGEVVVRFRFRKRRFECVVERASLRVVDSGICLINHATGEKGDTYFTLESLPVVINQAMQENRLVVFRNAG